LLNEEYLNETISAYAISVIMKNKKNRNGKESSINIEDELEIHEEGINHYEEDEEE